MRLFPAWRPLIAAAAALSLGAQAHASALPPDPVAGGAPPIIPTVPHAHQGGLSAAEIQQLSRDANQRVIIIMHDQYPSAPARRATLATRAATIAADQSPVLSELAQVRAKHVQAFQLINAVAATVSSAEAGRLSSDPDVRAVVPDRVITAPRSPLTELRRLGVGATALATPGGTACTSMVSLEPEALQLTNTAFDDPTIPQAQELTTPAGAKITGAGVKVAWFADGVDITNPDFIRPDGTPVFADYKDFTGDGPNAPTSGGEAFLDASSIAAQGRQIYDVTKPVTATNPQGAGVFVNPATNAAATSCKVRILGMAPGASLYGYKIFGQQNQSALASTTIQAIQYAVTVDDVDVLNESFGVFAYPDNATDPISLANDAAVAAGKTVVVSSGDAGTVSGLNFPATDPNVIAVGASTQFRLYQQTVLNGFQFGRGDYVSDNISALSSAGTSQNNNQTVSVVAGGDLGWALCSPDPAIYSACLDLKGDPSRVEIGGGTSESSPLVAGAAALVIQAYRGAHGGVTPSPALVRRLIMSTASDIGSPGYEQGAGLLDSLKAVQAALSVADGNGAPTPQGSGLLIDTGTVNGALTATGNPNMPETFTLRVTNVGATTQLVRVRARELAAPLDSASYALTLAPTTDPAIPVNFGFAGLGAVPNAYVEQDYTVPAGTQRLDAAIAWDVTKYPLAYLNLVLVDPQGRYSAYSLPQGLGNGYGHVDVNRPLAGTWKAYIYTFKAGDTLPFSLLSYTGTVHLDMASSSFVDVPGAGAPSDLILHPGESGTAPLTLRTPAQPGDLSEKVVVASSDLANPARQSAVAVPVSLRSLVPVDPSAGATFDGTLTGGNGRAPGNNAPGQTLTYLFDVPGGKHDLDVSMAITDTGYNLQGVLVDPAQQPVDIQSTITGGDLSTGAVTTTNTLQFFRRDPAAGRYKLILIINRNISGRETSIPFTAAIAFDKVSVQTSGVPNGMGTVLPAGAPAMALVRITNTGNTTKDYFVDPRLTTATTYGYDPISVTIPLTLSQSSAEPAPTFYIPPETTDLAVGGEALTPTAPISLDIANVDGAPPAGTALSPVVEGTSFQDLATGDFSALAAVSAAEVTPGLWTTEIVQPGPFDAPVTPVLGDVFAAFRAEQFDDAVSSSSGDFHAAILGLTDRYTPLTLAPGQSGAITVTITPSAAPGTIVTGHLYVDTLATIQAPGVGLSPITWNGDEVVAVPYSYTVGPRGRGGGGMATPELGSGELLATGLAPIVAALLYRRRRTRRARRVESE